VRVWNSAGSGKGQWQVHVSTPVTFYFCLPVCLLVGQFGWLSILLSVLELQIKIIADLTEFCSILYTVCLSLSASCQVTSVQGVCVHHHIVFL